MAPYDTMDIEALLFKINSSKPLEEREMNEVASLMELILDDPKIGTRVSVDDIYSLILVLGRAKNLGHRHLIERYLDSKDPLTVALALEILCLDWALTDEYLERVIHFALGTAWDREDDIRHVSLKILGEHLFRFTNDKRKTNDTFGEKEREVIALLLNILEDENGDQFTRQAAYYALCRGAGKPWEEIPSEYATLDLSPNSPDLDREILAYAKNLLTAQHPAEHAPNQAPKGAKRKRKTQKQ